MGDKTTRKTATDLSGDLRAKQLSAGFEHSCAINLKDKLYCWGTNSTKRLGLNDSKLDRIIPTEVNQANKLDKVSLVTAGKTTTCAVAGGKNYCWGDQYRGGLGNGFSRLENTRDAQEIDNSKITSSVKQFALGENSGCAIDATNDLWCWGYNEVGQVGDGESKNVNQPSPVKPSLQGSSKATMLAGGEYHYCIVDNATKVQCWGWNREGQLGIDSTTDSNSPKYVLASTTKSNHLSGVSKIATGSDHSCAIIAGGKVRCWGSSDYGVIGTDGVDDRLVADTYMPDIDNAINIAAGIAFTCVLLNDKTSVKCWGANSVEQLGNKDTTSDSSFTPVEVDGLKDIYQ